MPIQVDVFDDFHVNGASAPEWNQRYVQLSPGTMRSSLIEANASGAQVFRKWMSERVVQQGCLPERRICFALLDGPAQAMPRMQGTELREDKLFILRRGEEFTIQRPRGMALLTVAFPAENFLRLLDERPWPRQAMAMLQRPAVQVPRAALDGLRSHLLGMLRQRTPQRSADQVIVESLRLVFEGACSTRETVASASAGFIVAQCHRITAHSGDAPPDVEALCRRIRISRRSVQNSFRQVADTTAVHYLRSLRLNLVRKRLIATASGQLSVSQAAADQGFTHLSHFTARYKALFSELPSQTARRT